MSKKTGFFYQDEQTNFECTNYVHFRSRANWGVGDNFLSINITYQAGIWIFTLMHQMFQAFGGGL